MKQELIDYARILNTHDTKNLSQKLTKTVEEVGELARVILPFEDASGTLHRFVERNQILEEAVDVILCALSIAHDLEFTDEEVDQMTNKKLQKWGGMQDAEEAVSGKPIPYEIHITVNTPSHTIPDFQTACRKVGVKPIVLDLQVGTGTMEDVMTSSVHFGSNRSAYEEAMRVAAELSSHGFDIVRQKIETVPWHPASPKNQGDVMPKDCYFESHLAVLITTELEEKILAEIADDYGAHLSRNRFKTLDDGSYVIMITYRSYHAWKEMFEETLEELKDAIVCQELQVDKEIVEFSIFDTKVNHDAAWIAS